MLALIVVGKFLVWLAVILTFRYTISTAVLAAIGLTQIGEFSFVMVKTAMNAGLVSQDIYNATLVASLTSILINAHSSELSLSGSTSAEVHEVFLARRIAAVRHTRLTRPTGWPVQQDPSAESCMKIIFESCP